jgi:hypothetical protein
MTEALEHGRRRAEIDGLVVTFSRVTGNVRRSNQPVWWCEANDLAHARRLAKRWVSKAKLGKPVIH